MYVKFEGGQRGVNNIDYAEDSNDAAAREHTTFD